jgi:hypothetical protein
MRKFLITAVMAVASLCAYGQTSTPTAATQFGGQFTQSAYANYAVQGTNFVPAGSQVLNLNTSTILLSDSRTALPFLVGTPLTVDNGTLQEVVTITQANCTVPNQPCTIVATFTHPHSAPFRVATATFGLQEAINDAFNNGGGTVLVDGFYTTGLLTSAVAYSNVALQIPRAGTFTVYTDTAGVYALQTFGGGVQVAGDIHGTNSHPIVSTVLNGLIPVTTDGSQVMTAPLVLSGNPTSSLQAADKAYVDASAAGSLKASPAASQIVLQPTGSSFDTNIFNGVNYAAQFTTGGLQNGIHNAAAASPCVFTVGSPLTTGCAQGQQVIVDDSYLGYPTSGAEEISVPFPACQYGANLCGVSVGVVNNAAATVAVPFNTSLWDQRGGVDSLIYSDPYNRFYTSTLPTLSTSTASGNSGLAREWTASYIVQRGNSQDIPFIFTLDQLAGGQNGSQGYGNKSNLEVIQVNGNYYSLGQHNLVTQTMDCTGLGDCLQDSVQQTTSAGISRGGDEGQHRGDSNEGEDYAAFYGSLTAFGTSATTPSYTNSVTVTGANNNGNQGEGRYVIDLSQPGGGPFSFSTALGATPNTGTCTGATYAAGIATAQGCSSISGVAAKQAIIMSGFTSPYTAYNVPVATITAVYSTATAPCTTAPCISYVVSGSPGTATGASATWSASSYQNIIGSAQITGWVNHNSNSAASRVQSASNPWTASTLLGVTTSAVGATGFGPFASTTLSVSVGNGSDRCSSTGAFYPNCTSSATTISNGEVCIADSDNIDYGWVTGGPYTITSNAATITVLNLQRAHGSGAMIAQGGSSCSYFSMNSELTNAGGTTVPLRYTIPVIGCSSAGDCYFWYTTGGSYGAILGSTTIPQSGGNAAWSYVNATGKSANNTSGALTVFTATGISFLNRGAPIASINLLQSAGSGNLLGQTVTVSGASDSTVNGNYVFQAALSGPGTAAITGYNTFTFQTSGTSSVETETGLTFTVCNCTMTLYTGAEVVGVYDTTKNALDGLLNISPNSTTWNITPAADLIEESHWAQNFIPNYAHNKITNYLPQDTAGQSGEGVTYQGTVTGEAAGYIVVNNASTNIYYGLGGTHNMPSAGYIVEGPFSNTITTYVAPDATVVKVGCKNPTPGNSDGCTKWDADFGLFSLPNVNGGGQNYIYYYPQTNTVYSIMGGNGGTQTFTGQDVIDTNQNLYQVGGVIATASCTGGSVTAGIATLTGCTFNAVAGTVGQRVTVSGFTPSSYNVTNAVITAVSPSTGGSGTISFAATGTVVTVGGTFKITSPGFSTSGTVYSTGLWLGVHSGWAAGNVLTGISGTGQNIVSDIGAALASPTMSSPTLNGSTTVPSGQTITIASGATITINGTCNGTTGCGAPAIPGSSGNVLINSSGSLGATATPSVTNITLVTGIAGTNGNTYTPGTAAGSGATASCYQGVCDSIGGTITLVTGTGTTSAGTALTVAFANARTNIPSCIVQASLTGGAGQYTTFSMTENTSGFVFGSGTAAMAASSTYRIRYTCEGK